MAIRRRLMGRLTAYRWWPRRGRGALRPRAAGRRRLAQATGRLALRRGLAEFLLAGRVSAYAGSGDRGHVGFRRGVGHGRGGLATEQGGHAMKVSRLAPPPQPPPPPRRS